MPYCPITFSVKAADEQHEQWLVNVCGRRAGEATVTYEGATASVAAHVNLDTTPLGVQHLHDFHVEFSTELLSHMLDRGAMAQESKGTITYEYGAKRHHMNLPTHQEIELGYPNSW